MTVLRFSNRQRKVRLDLPVLKRMALLALPDCLSHSGESEAVLPTLAVIEVTIVSDAVISSIHARFLGEASATDVITFPYGEIIISAETAASNARRYGHSPTVETALCVIHGLLHLNGYDDRSVVQFSKMAKRQRAILQAVCRKM